MRSQGKREGVEVWEAAGASEAKAPKDPAYERYARILDRELKDYDL